MSGLFGGGGGGTPGGSDTQLQFNDGGAFGGSGLTWNKTTSAFGLGANLTLFRQDNNTLALRNGASAQAFQVYNTYTNASNGEWGAMRWNLDSLEIGTFANGTGSNRTLALVVGGVSALQIIPSQSSIRLPNATSIEFGNSSTRIFANASGFAILQNGLWFTIKGSILAFGGETSSFPALKRSAATLQARLADDSAFADLVFRIPTSNPGPGTLWNNAGVLTIGT